MTDEFNNSRYYKLDRSHFGGKIYNYDFDGYTTISDIAQRIATDEKFDRMCAKNIMDREYRWIKKGLK